MDRAATPIQPSSADGTVEQDAFIWHPLKRFGFRFVFGYLSLFCSDLVGFVISNLKFFGGSSAPEKPPLSAYLWGRTFPWLGTHIFHFSKVINPLIVNTDGRYEWVITLVDLVLALLAAVVWTALDSNRRNYRVLWGWLTVVVRTLLAIEMLYYGIGKGLSFAVWQDVAGDACYPAGCNQSLRCALELYGCIPRLHHLRRRDGSNGWIAASGAGTDSRWVRWCVRAVMVNVFATDTCFTT